MNKLLLTFNQDSEVIGIPIRLIFNNEKDATEYLEGIEGLSSIRIEPQNNYFRFCTPAWDGNGSVQWVRYIG